MLDPEDERVGDARSITQLDIRRTTWTTSPVPMPPPTFTVTIMISAVGHPRYTDFTMMRGTLPVIGSEHASGVLRAFANLASVAAPTRLLSFAAKPQNLDGGIVKPGDASFSNGVVVWQVTHLMLRGVAAATEWAFAHGHSESEAEVAIMIRYALRENQLLCGRFPHLRDMCTLGYSAECLRHFRF